MTNLCLCQSGELYKSCCRPFHNGRRRPKPVELMRSRFAAYALGKVGYVVKTEHPQSPRRQQDSVTFRKEIKQFCEQTTFVGLQILDSVTLSEMEATVTFHAVLLQDGKDVSFTECSLFRRGNGRWLYVKPK